MSAERIRELRGLGIDFGSHGAGHLKLAQQSTELIRDDVRRSKAALEDVLGEAVRHFCYPTAVMTAAPSTRSPTPATPPPPPACVRPPPRPTIH